MISFVLFSLVSSTFRPDHEVVMSTVAPWDESPLFEHVLFFMTDFSADLATSFLKEIIKNHDKINNETYIWKTAYKILPIYHHAYLKSQIEIGFYAPRGEMYREMARTKGGSSFPDLMVIGKKLDTKDISCHYLPSDELDVQPFELQYGVPQSIVYANILNKDVADFVLRLIESNTPFSLRPTSKTGKFGINLRGFGIEMRPFKYSMEYGVKDSIILESKDEVHLHKDETTENIKGIPDSYYDLQKEEFFAEKFTSWVEKHNDTDLVRLMRDFSNNYPLYMSEILNTNITNSSVKDLSRLYNIRANGKMVSSINGRVVSPNNLDVFTLLDVINKERTARQILRDEFKLNNTMLNKVFKSRKIDISGVFFDTRSKYVQWFDNVTEDPRFENYNDDFEIFSGPLYQMPRVRRPLAQYVIFVDPTTFNGFYQVYWGANLVEDGFPVNFGIVPSFNLGNKISRRVAFAFYHIARNVNSSEAIQFLIDSFLIAGIDKKTNYANMATVATYKASYKLHSNSKCLKWSKLYKLYAGSPELEMIFSTKKYISDTHVHIPSNFMNGKEIDTVTGMQSIHYHAQMQITEIGRLISQYGIKESDPFDSLNLISRNFFLAKTLDNKVLNSIPVSLKISSLTYDRQLEYLEFISNTKFDYVDEGQINTYYFLFCNDTVNTSTFKEFSNKKNRFNKSKFKVNPEIPYSLRSIFPSDKSICSLVVNGRVYRDIDASNIEFLDLVDDWNTYFVMDQIYSVGNCDSSNYSEFNTYLSSLYIDWMSDDIVRRFQSDNLFNVNNTLIHSTKNSTSDIVWEILIDPTTRNFQRISSIIDWVEKQNLAQVHLCILPPFELNESFTTLTTYYRNTLTDDIAVFRMLNDTTTYSIMPDMPMSWVYESMRASTDLDNILLSDLRTHSQEGVYVVTNLLVEGTCFTTTQDTASGTELQLTNEHNERCSDTIVMQNGYFQLQGNPGFWNIELGGSISASIFELPPSKLVIGSFVNPLKVINVKYLPGKEGLEVNNISRTCNFRTTDRVDVFTVASGHLYERLMKIMMLSVRKRSTHKVKFWLVKNFLSPTFKATLPLMSTKYNFTYQLISYKWPTWLRPQFEKQRIIWGNKILFLDTIFPLDLERVIYIDSDQIVRTDLNELMRMDFEGCPYAFTPMCNSRNETEPFRFWKQGYWHEYLQGKPYHISALFAVDLVRFRELSAGDQLRFHYQQLSSDPGSLSNLDQDLPNYAQHSIPIFSLPQEWLWCETWCSDETMSTAKTIDLCNNPLTKSPKLHIAQTRIEEWPSFDSIARNISAHPNDYQYQFFKNEI